VTQALPGIIARAVNHLTRLNVWNDTRRRANGKIQMKPVNDRLWQTKNAKPEI